MSELARWAMVTAALGGIGGLCLLGRPGSAKAFLERFPRNGLLGWILSAVAYGAGAVALWHAPPEWMAGWRDTLWVLAPVAWLMTGFFLDELLAPRALGGLLLLAASPILDAARFHPSPARIVVVFLAYGGVGFGLWWVASPWGFRQMMRPILAAPARIRLTGGILLCVSALLAALGAAVF